MRPLDEKETTQVFEMLFKFTGPNLNHLLDRPAVEGPDAEPGRYCLRLHRNRVYYASEALVRRATAVSRPRLAGVGTPIGRFTHHGAFHLTAHALDLLAAHARRRVWLIPRARHRERQGQGRGGRHVHGRRPARVRRRGEVGAGTNAVVVLHQADAGEYLRKEELM
jgi:60S ribosome subunit biogenesis protein NIP7